ncbi:hypothetical protein OSB04_003521 [Centaurea solstitialis]|uniref:Uncharacterized protein n=1 Tax=Centaurea solstitialis TaxID=347529 RepID=A0AA38TV14_9ASTR|nr:hypothetical protein OSB04_003521 [Centaurea solstitialis]
MKPFPFLSADLIPAVPFHLENQPPVALTTCRSSFTLIRPSLSVSNFINHLLNSLTVNSLLPSSEFWIMEVVAFGTWDRTGQDGTKLSVLRLAQHGTEQEFSVPRLVQHGTGQKLGQVVAAATTGSHYWPHSPCLPLQQPPPPPLHLYNCQQLPTTTFTTVHLHHNHQHYPPSSRSPQPPPPPSSLVLPSATTDTSTMTINISNILVLALKDWLARFRALLGTKKAKGLIDLFCGIQLLTGIWVGSGASPWIGLRVGSWAWGISRCPYGSGYPGNAMEKQENMLSKTNLRQ